MQGGSLNESLLRSAIQKLVAQKPRDYVAILNTLKRLVRIELERKTVTIESADPLDLEERNRAADLVIAQYGKDLTFQYQVTPEILGGLRIKVGDDVLDGSVQGRINRLAQAF
jgi:F-type H+-transporting ATPase subunit delta